MKAIDWCLAAPQFHVGITILALIVIALAWGIRRELKSQRNILAAICRFLTNPLTIICLLTGILLARDVRSLYTKEMPDSFFGVRSKVCVCQEVSGTGIMPGWYLRIRINYVNGDEWVSPIVSIRDRRRKSLDDCDGWMSEFDKRVALVKKDMAAK